MGGNEGSCGEKTASGDGRQSRGAWAPRGEAASGDQRAAPVCHVPACRRGTLTRPSEQLIARSLPITFHGSFFFRVLTLKTWFTWRVREFCFSQRGAKKSLGFFRGPQCQSCFHSNTQILFAFFTHSLQVHNPVNQCFPSNHCTKLSSHAWVNEPECKTDRKMGRSEYTCWLQGSGPPLQLVFKKLLLRLP